MGYPFDTLVPAAVLLDNPGLTKEEFSERLDRVESEGGQSGYYHAGLHGMARILKLKERPEYRKAQNRHRDPKTGETTQYMFVHGYGKFPFEVTISDIEHLDEMVIETHDSNYTAGGGGA